GRPLQVGVEGLAGSELRPEVRAWKPAVRVRAAGVQMVSAVAPGGTMAASWPSRPVSWRGRLQAAGWRAGHRPEANALVTMGPTAPKLENSPLEAATQSLGSCVAATPILPPPGEVKPMREVGCFPPLTAPATPAPP